MTKKILKNKSKDELIDEILDLDKENEKLEEENKKLKEELERLRGQLKIDSKNSSKPSSTNNFNKNTPVCNSREKGKNPRGGKKGHKGANLKRSKKVDKIVDLTPNKCKNCGHKFSKSFLNQLEKITRQVIDLSELKQLVTDYKNANIKCPKCGFFNVTEFPEDVTRPVQFGKNIKAFSVYLNNHGLLSFDRIQQLFLEVFGIEISQTSLSNFNKNGFSKLENFEKQIEKALLKQNIIHADESGIRVEGGLNWVHVVSTKLLTLLKLHKKRGREAFKDNGILPKYKGIVISDNFSSYKNKYDFKQGLCNAHHLRELNWVDEFEKKKWAMKLKKLLLKAKKLKEETQEKGITFLEKTKIEEIRKEYLNILEKGEKEYGKVEKKSGKRGRVKRKKGHNLLLRLRKSINETLFFIENFNVPFDNNQAERDLRMIKTKVKVSGCFRSFKGGEYFLRIRSYIGTLRKQQKETYSAILSLFGGNTIIPDM